MTNESIEDDWRFEIWVDAILGEFPEDEFDEAEEDEEGG